MRTSCGAVGVLAVMCGVAACVGTNGDSGATTTVRQPAPIVGAHPRATITDGFDITLATTVVRASGDRENNEDNELFLAFKNRAVFNVTVQNRSDGWAPVNFEVCIDHPDALAVVDPANEYLETNAVVDDPCVVRYEDGHWPVVEKGSDSHPETDPVFRVGAVEAKEAGGGYLTVYFRGEFEKAGIVDLYEYTVPYRVLPHH